MQEKCKCSLIKVINQRLNPGETLLVVHTVLHTPQQLIMNTTSSLQTALTLITSEHIPSSEQ